MIFLVAIGAISFNEGKKIKAIWFARVVRQGHFTADGQPPSKRYLFFRSTQGTSAAQRKPTSGNASAGLPAKRVAARINQLGSSQAPPRSTLSEPESGPVGFKVGELR